MLSEEQIDAIIKARLGNVASGLKADVTVLVEDVIASLRAQADAQPVGWLISPNGAFRENPVSRVSGPTTLEWKLPVYLHPAPEAAQALSELALDKLVDDCLKITEGKRHPFGKDTDTWADMRRAVELVLTRSAATVAEPSKFVATTPEEVSDMLDRITQQAEPSAFRASVERMVTMLEEGEWAEHVATTTGKGDPLAQRLENAITNLINEASGSTE
jgi:hypothetical protein